MNSTSGQRFLLADLIVAPYAPDSSAIGRASGCDPLGSRHGVRPDRGPQVVEPFRVCPHRHVDARSLPFIRGRGFRPERREVETGRPLDPLIDGLRPPDP